MLLGLVIMLYLVNREKQMRKVSSDEKFLNDKKTVVGDLSRSKGRFIATSFDGQSTKDLSSVQRRATSAIKSSSGFNRTTCFHTLSNRRQKEITQKYNFSKAELEVYERICMKMKNLNEREKLNFISMILERTNI